MRLTKFTHACVRLEKDGSVLVLDPGNFSEAEEALRGAEYLLITHEHPDHYDRDPVHAFLTAHPEVPVYAPADVAAEIRQAVPSARDVHAVEADVELEVGPFRVQTFGGQHALIHPLVPMVQNVGYLIDGNLYHPGDNVVVPDGVHVQNLLVPIHAPWNKIREVIDFIIAVGAPNAYQIHDGLLGEKGFGVIENMVTTYGAKYGTTYRHLDTRETIDL